MRRAAAMNQAVNAEALTCGVQRLALIVWLPQTLLLHGPGGLRGTHSGAMDQRHSVLTESQNGVRQITYFKP